MAARSRSQSSSRRRRQSGERYYCHKCEREVRIVGSDLKCPNCHLGFLEVIDHLEPTQAGALVDMGSLLRNTAGRRTGTAGAPGPGGASSSNFAPMQGVFFQDFLQQLLETIGGEQMHGGQGVHFQMNINGQNVGTTDGLTPGHFLFNFLQNPGNYVFGDDIDAIVTQLLNQVEGGAPPLSSDDMKALKRSEITPTDVENKMQCPVCFDNFKLKENVVVLVCKHSFHEDCIMPWLGRHNSCPVCRKPAGEDSPEPVAAQGQENERGSAAPGESAPPPRNSESRGLDTMDDYD